MNTNPFRTGFFTSEFLTTILGIVASVFVAKGIITVAQIPGFIDKGTQDLVSIYSGIVALIAIYKLVKRYVDSRTALKTSMLQKSQAQAQTAHLTQPS